MDGARAVRPSKARINIEHGRSLREGGSQSLHSVARDEDCVCECECECVCVCVCACVCVCVSMVGI